METLKPCRFFNICPSEIPRLVYLMLPNVKGYLQICCGLTRPGALPFLLRLFSLYIALFHPLAPSLLLRLSITCPLSPTNIYQQIASRTFHISKVTNCFESLYNPETNKNALTCYHVKWSIVGQSYYQDGTRHRYTHLLQGDNRIQLPTSAIRWQQNMFLTHVRQTKTGYSYTHPVTR